MQIYINGEPEIVGDGSSVADIVAKLELAGQRIAVEVNEELVPRSTFVSHILSDGDHVEIVHAIGGG